MYVVLYMVIRKLKTEAESVGFDVSTPEHLELITPLRMNRRNK